MIYWNAGEGLTDASDMGFAPGEWPKTFVYPDNTGAPRVFKKDDTHLYRGEIVSVKYRNGDGTVIIVLND